MSNKLDINLNLKSSKGGMYAYGKSTSYTEVFEITQTLDNTDGYILLALFTPGSKAASTLEGAEAVVIHNPSDQVAELQLRYDSWHDDSGDKTSGTQITAANIIKLLRPNEYLYYPNIQAVNYEDSASPSNATTLSGAPETDLESSGAITTLGAAVSSATTTTITPSDVGALFYAGDRIKIDDEIMIVQVVGSTTLTVERGTHGSTAATHSDSTNIELAHFNHLYDDTHAIYGSSAVCMTDAAGNFECSNFFGYGRSLLTPGLTKGSVSLTFYTHRAHQDISFKIPINAQTDTKLTGGNTYQIALIVDDSAETELSFTVDSSNTKFGGKNGVVQKIRDAITTASTLGSGGFEGFPFDVSIVNGKLRFSSKSYMYAHDGTNGSKIAMNSSASYSGTKVFGQGIFPASPDGVRDAAIAPDEIKDKSGNLQPNLSGMLMDDGYGNLKSPNGSLGVGTIDYNSGAISIRGGLPNATFNISATVLSALSGEPKTTSQLLSIAARSTSPKRNTRVSILAFN